MVANRSQDGTPDAALDAVAAILRALRDTAVRDSEAASRLEAWARHILVLATPPGSGDTVSLSRDWAGLGNHVVAYVRDDRAAVSRSIGELQDTVWLVIERSRRRSSATLRRTPTLPASSSGYGRRLAARQRS